MSHGAMDHTPELAPDDRFGLRHAALWLDRGIGMLTESVGAVIVVVETFVLFAGVVSRYVFDSPLIWTDELGSFLFLWLAMLGTVVALRNDGHMRLTTLVNWVRPSLWPLVLLGRRAGGGRVRAADPEAGAELCRRGALYVELTTLGISDGLSRGVDADRHGPRRDHRRAAADRDHDVARFRPRGAWWSAASAWCCGCFRRN